MKRLSSALVFLALTGCALFHAEPAEAATVTVTWVNPTLNTDDSAIPTDGTQPGALASWIIEYGSCAAGGAFGVKAGEVIRARAAGGPELTSGTFNLNPQTVCVRVIVVNSYGNNADPSNVASRVIPPPKPRPATGVLAT